MRYQRKTPDPIQFIPGDTIRFESGEYDSYQVDGLWNVLRPFTDHEAIKWFSDRYPDEQWSASMCDFLQDLCFIEQVSETHSWHWRDSDGLGYAIERAK